MRDLVYRHSVLHSSAADYDHCGHLVTSGDPGWSWVSGDSGSEWLRFELDGLSTVFSVRITWETPAPEAEVRLSCDGKTWVTVRTVRGEAGVQEIPLGGMQARSVHLQFTMPGGRRCAVSGVEIVGEGPENRLPDSEWRISRAPDTEADGETLSGDYDDSAWLPAAVPGTALVSWRNAGCIPEINIADNQFQISDAYFLTDFWYRRTFDAPEGEGRLWLRFRQVNWKAEVWLNGVQLGRIEGAFLRAKWDITDIVKPTGNHLAVKVFTNATPGPVKVHTRETAGPNGGPLGADNPTIHAAAGWDWMPTMRGRNVGLIGDVDFFRTANTLILEDPWVKTKLRNENRTAELTVAAVLRNTGSRPVSARFSGTIEPGGLSFRSETVTLDPGKAREVSAEATAEDPRLWWPNTYGEAFLYTASIHAETDGEVCETHTFRFGIRELKYSEGWPLVLRCNGVRIVCRGGNWGMDDACLRCKPEDYDIRVRFHKDMNFTMIRNWVGMVGNPAFYEACDRYGILVWDDFWLANPVDGPDPDDTEMFLRNAWDKIEWVRQHPCVALYCGRNEGYPPERLDIGLRSLCKVLDGTRTYISHSALGSVSGFGPYHSAGPEYYFGHTYHTLHSERGMINIPSLETMKVMLTEAHLWPVDETWALHDFCRGGAMRSDEFEKQLRESYGNYHSLSRFVRLAQLLDYSNHKAMFEAVFAGKSQGLLMWMSNPAWPSTVWQTYDWRYDINGGYQGCKDACRPVNAIYDVLKEEIALINATGKARTLTLKMELFDLSGKLLRTETVTRDAPADCAEYVMEAPRWMDEVQLLRLTVFEEGQEPVENGYWLNGWEHLNYRGLSRLPMVRLQGKLMKTEDGFAAEITNPCKAPALMTEVRLRDPKTGETILPVFSDRNFLTLLPGETKTVHLSTNAASAELKLGGFNVKEV